MLTYAAAATPNTLAVMQEVHLGARDDDTPSGATSAAGSDGLFELRVGQARYEFLKRVRVTYSWQVERWICWSPDLGLFYRGEGDTPGEARRLWAERVHAEFQGLYAKRPFEMSQEERDRWRSLLNIIDVLEYRETIPLALREVGQVRWGKFPYPKRIEWIDGRVDVIDFDRVPPEVAGFKPGQWIEADVKRDPRTNRLISIEHVQRIASLLPMSEEQADRYWEGLPSAQLPEREWDWPADDGG